MREAFDAVIPGYPDAWNRAMVNRDPAGASSRRARRWDGQRQYLRFAEERCMLLYNIQRSDSYSEDRALPRDPNVMTIENRGYVPLMNVRFADRREALKALYEMRDPGVELNNWRHAKSSGTPYEPDSQESFFWTYDGTDFDARCKITLRVLDYIREHAISIDPIWERFTEILAQQS